MDDSLRVRRLERGGDLGASSQGFIDGERSLLQPPRQGLALDVLEDQEARGLVTGSIDRRDALETVDRS